MVGEGESQITVTENQGQTTHKHCTYQRMYSAYARVGAGHQLLVLVLFSCTIDKRGGRGLETRNARIESGAFRH